MNVIDIIITVIGAFCFIRGIFRGILKEITSIIGVFVGFYAAYTYYPLLAKVLSQLITNKSYLNIISFLLAFTILFLSVSFLGIILKHIFKAAALGWMDHILGGAFGIAKALLIVSVLLVGLTVFLPKNSPFISNSLLVPHVSIISEKMATVIPKEMKAKFRRNIRALKGSWAKR